MFNYKHVTCLFMQTLPRKFTMGATIHYGSHFGKIYFVIGDSIQRNLLFLGSFAKLQKLTISLPR